MNTRSTLDLTGTVISDLQLTSNSRRQTPSSGIVDDNSNSIKEETSSSSTSSSNLSNNPRSTSRLFSTMTTNDDLIELEEIQRKHSNIEKRFLDRIPFFKSSEEMDMEEFLSKSETVFDQLHYSDDNRISKIEEKLDDSSRPFFNLWKQNGKINWNDFKVEFPKVLHGSTLPKTFNDDMKSSPMTNPPKNNPDEKCLTLNSLRLEVLPFSGDSNARQWFTRIDSKFCESKLSMDHRLEILPYLLVGDATIWFSCNREQIRSYTDFCQLFVRDYIQSPDPIHYDTNKNEPYLLHTPSITNGTVANNNPRRYYPREENITCLSQYPIDEFQRTRLVQHQYFTNDIQSFD